MNSTKYKHYYHDANRIPIPAYLFASREYSENVSTGSKIDICGVLEYHRELFKIIGECASIEDAGRIFHDFITELFELDQKVKGKKVNSYIKILRGWMFDSNSLEGAVVKGWVESRFGIPPFFHKKPIKGIHSEEYYEYMKDRMTHALQSNMIEHQLDLLYTYTQFVLRRFFDQYIPSITLYRGVNDLKDHHVMHNIDGKTKLISHNSIVSFTNDREVADQFGDHIMSIVAPFTKIVFFSGILPQMKFSGEMEFLVIGGDYITQLSYY